MDTYAPWSISFLLICVLVSIVNQNKIGRLGISQRLFICLPFPIHNSPLLKERHIECISAFFMPSVQRKQKSSVMAIHALLEDYKFKTTERMDYCLECRFLWFAKAEFALWLLCVGVSVP